MGEFILQPPQTWSFSTLSSAQGMAFLIPIAVAVAAALACFLGFRFVLTVLFLGGAVASGCVGLHFLQRFSVIDYVKVLVFLIAMCIGGCLMYALSALCRLLIRNLHLKKAARFFVAYLVPVLCAALLFWTLWKKIYTGLPVDAAVSAAILLLGLLVQKKTGIMRRELRQFED